MMRQSSSSPRSSHACESPLAFPCTLGDLSVSSDVAKKPPVRPSLPPRACHPVRPARCEFIRLCGRLGGFWARARRSPHFHSRQTLSCEPRSSIAAQRCVQCISPTHCKYRSTMVLVFILSRKSIPNAMALGRWTFTVSTRAWHGIFLRRAKPWSPPWKWRGSV